MILFVGCFDIIVYNDVIVEDMILKFILILIRLEFYVVLSELKVFVGYVMFLFEVVNFE